MKISNNVIFFLIILAVLSAVFNDKITKFFTSTPDNVQSGITKIKSEREEAYPTINVPVIQPTDLNNLSKQSIYKLRKNRVADSIFADEKYEPSEEVFGQIESYKPWISNDICKDPETKTYSDKGPSEEARFINNPALLVAIEYPFSFSNFEDAKWCTDPETTMIPKKITYNKVKKEIIVTYANLPFLTDDGYSFYIFNGLNARDLGYKYAYLDKSKSTYDIEFSNSYNISREVVEFENYIHVGGSCGIPGGCNNGSPRQRFLEFKQDYSNYEDTNREIYIKLWKNKPHNKNSEPDMVEKIILEKS